MTHGFLLKVSTTRFKVLTICLDCHFSDDHIFLYCVQDNQVMDGLP